MGVSFLFMSVETSEAEFRACPDKSFRVGGNTVECGGEAGAQLDLFIDVVLAVK